MNDKELISELFKRLTVALDWLMDLGVDPEHVEIKRIVEVLKKGEKLEEN
jgi:hypothetical protein